MEKTAWVVKAIKVNGEVKELGDAPMGGVIFKNGKPTAFIEWDGGSQFDVSEVSEVLTPDCGWMSKEDFLQGDFEDFLQGDKYLSSVDFKTAEYKDRFISRTKYKKIGFLSAPFFNTWSTSINYIYNGKLCYLKHLDTSFKSNFTLYEVREII